MNNQYNKVIILFASGFSSQEDPRQLAEQLKSENIFIITIDFNDVLGVVDELLSEISSPSMNISSSALDYPDKIINCLCISKL